MPRSRSSYTASPTRHRSPLRSLTRRPPSEEGSQYELDLSALGLGSNIDSSGLEGTHGPQLDVIDTSDIDGPEDFTMNMTYWMTVDLSSQIKSRKEAKAVASAVRGDAQKIVEDKQETTEDGDEAVIEDSSKTRDVSEGFNSASPTMRGNGTANSLQDDGAPSQSSMENDEKVMSYLSALPDTDLPGAITSTPLKIKNANTLIVPTPIIPRNGSLQATVEDYDTPRKPTQDTVIHHNQSPSMIIDTSVQDTLRNQIAELRLHLDQEELTSKTRITELETILSYTRSELEASRAEYYKHKERVDGMEKENERRKQNQDANEKDFSDELRKKEQELNTRMQEFGEELRLQHMAKLQNQREDYERRLREIEETKRVADGQVEEKDHLLEQLRCEMDQLQRTKESEADVAKEVRASEQQKRDVDFSKERTALTENLLTLQAQAETLRTQLARATEDAQCARREAEVANREAEIALQEPRIMATSHSMSDISQQTPRKCISDLESRLHSLQSQLASSQADVSEKDQQLLRRIQQQEQQEQRLNAAQGRNEGLESTISTLRQQLADTHREHSRAKTDIERFEQDIEQSTERLEDAKKEADRRVADVEKRLSKLKELKVETEARFNKLQSEHGSLVQDHEAQLENVRFKAEDAVRKAGALLDTERREKQKLAKELKSTQREVDQLRTEAIQKEAEKDSDEESSISSTHSLSKDGRNRKLPDPRKETSRNYENIEIRDNHASQEEPNFLHPHC